MVIYYKTSKLSMVVSRRKYLIQFPKCFISYHITGSEEILGVMGFQFKQKYFPRKVRT